MIKQVSGEGNDLPISAVAEISSLTDTLIKEIHKQGIRIVSSSSGECERILEAYGGKMHSIGSGWFPELGIGKIIVISPELLHKYLEGERGVMRGTGDWEFTLAHEIAHFNFYGGKEPSCLFQDAPRNKLRGLCPYVEYLVDEKALYLLDSLLEGIASWRPEIEGKIISAREYWEAREEFLNKRVYLSCNVFAKDPLSKCYFKRKLDECISRIHCFLETSSS